MEPTSNALVNVGSERIDALPCADGDAVVSFEVVIVMGAGRITRHGFGDVVVPSDQAVVADIVYLLIGVPAPGFRNPSWSPRT